MTDACAWACLTRLAQQMPTGTSGRNAWLRWLHRTHRLALRVGDDWLAEQVLWVPARLESRTAFATNVAWRRRLATSKESK